MTETSGAPVTIVVTGAADTGRRYRADGIDIDNGALVVTRGDDASNVVAAYAAGCWASAHQDGAVAPEAEGDPKGLALYIAVSALTDIAGADADEDLRAIAEKALSRAAEAHPGLLS